MVCPREILLTQLFHLDHLILNLDFAVDDLGSAVTDPVPPSYLPHIDPYHSSNISALSGADTKLNCRVYRHHASL